MASSIITGGQLAAAQGAATSVGENIVVVAGAGGATSGAGGVASVTGGAGTAGNSAGGIGKVVGGAGQGTAAGGAAQVTGGASGSGATGNGGAAQVTGGAASSTNGNGGSVILTGGALAGTGVAGNVHARSRFIGVTSVTAMTTTAAITVAAIRGGLITANQGAAGAATYTTPTGTELDAAFTSIASGDSIDFSVQNISTNAAEDVTLDGGSGVTDFGNMVVASNDGATSISWGTFRLIRGAANTYTMYRVG